MNLIYYKKTMKLIYKKIPPNDYLNYRSLRLESLKLNPEAFESDYEEALTEPQLHFEKIIKKDDASKFVTGAYFEGELVGICAFVDYNNHDVISAGTLIQMYVTPKFRGNNICFNLIDTVTHYVLNIPHIDKIMLEVKETNHSAVKVYKKMDFNFLASDSMSNTLIMIKNIFVNHLYSN